MAADEGADGNWSDEPQPVEAVVQTHRHSLYWRDDLIRHGAHQRKDQETVSDGAAQLGFSCALGIDMDELVIFRRVRECVDPVLGNVDPGRHADLTTHLLLKLFDAPLASHSDQTSLFQAESKHARAE